MRVVNTQANFPANPTPNAQAQLDVRYGVQFGTTTVLSNFFLKVNITPSGTTTDGTQVAQTDGLGALSARWFRRGRKRLWRTSSHASTQAKAIASSSSAPTARSRGRSASRSRAARPHQSRGPNGPGDQSVVERHQRIVIPYATRRAHPRIEYEPRIAAWPGASDVARCKWPLCAADAAAGEPGRATWIEEHQIPSWRTSLRFRI